MITLYVDIMALYKCLLYSILFWYSKSFRVSDHSASRPVSLRLPVLLSSDDQLELTLEISQVHHQSIKVVILWRVAASTLWLEIYTRRANLGWPLILILSHTIKSSWYLRTCMEDLKCFLITIEIQPLLQWAFLCKTYRMKTSQPINVNVSVYSLPCKITISWLLKVSFKHSC